MPDKTRLELEIEHHERYLTPVSVKTILIVLIICLCVLGIYAFNLKKELAKIEQENILIKDTFRKEKVELLRQIKQLQAKRSSSKSEIN